MTVVLMLEGIALAVIGALAHHYIETDQEKRDILSHLSLGVIAGVVAFALMGEPTSATAIGYVAAGYFAPSFIKNAVERWKDKLLGMVARWGRNG